ncbi:MAG: ferredoxin, partial [Gammaproteobacteria bacterium]|nr:ferredoxin [Gammaproteobacteria bacterium]
GASYIDTEALSGLIGQRRQGSVIMPAERRRRIEGALAVLQGFEDESVLVTFVVASKDPSIERSPMVEVIDDADPCRAAAAVHDREAKRVAPVFAAARIAGLEIEDRYDPAVHDSWFAGFDWHAFSEAEMQLVTKVVALESAGRVARDGLPSFSSLLGSRKPVHILISVNAVDNPGATPDEDPFRSFRFELGYFGIGHRQVLVAQTSAARYEDTLSGFVSALDGTRTSLHLVNRGNRTQTSQPRLDPWIVASAALESRAHPFVLVNPDAGDHAAERVRFNSTPQPERDWSIETLQFRDAQGEVAEMQMAFTFADYCLLMPELHEYFRIVPIGCESEDLVPVGDYLNLAEDRLDRCVPFVWAVDVDGMLHRVVVSRILTLACRDRQNYWHSLQELAGIRNIYVEQAKEQVRQEEQLAFASECERLQESFTEELERVRAEAAGAVMGQLVDVLMGGDFAGLLESGGRSAGETASSADLRSEPPSETEPAPTEPESEPGAEEEEESVSFDDPWIDSMMCTTCDDCMGINKVVFVYNENKQAIIADPSAGTYADMVQAAEICPAKCIHPGKPLDPNEPGLDELVARAEPFN